MFGGGWRRPGPGALVWGDLITALMTFSGGGGGSRRRGGECFMSRSVHFVCIGFYGFWLAHFVFLRERNVWFCFSKMIYV